MNSKKIAFFDSGVGGIPYLLMVAGRYPEGKYFYCADTKYFPYGQKPDERIREIVLEGVGRLIDSVEPDLVVVACNTASVVALGALRDTFPLPFVGVVPAVKPAARISTVKRIGLLATSRTVAEAYTDNLIQSFASDCRVFRLASPELVTFVEHGYPSASAEEIEGALRDTVDWCVENRIDTLILGCTHFIFLGDHLARLLGPGVAIVDSVEGVGNQALRVLGVAADTRKDLSLPQASFSACPGGCGQAGSHAAAPAVNGFFYETGSLGETSAVRYFCALAGLEFRGTVREKKTP